MDAVKTFYSVERDDDGKQFLEVRAFSEGHGWLSSWQEWNLEDAELCVIDGLVSLRLSPRREVFVSPPEKAEG